MPEEHSTLKSRFLSVSARGDRAFNVLGTISGLIVVAMMVHMCSDVFMRYVFNRPIQGTLEVVSAHYMVLSVFIPLGLIEWKKKAIVVDILFIVLPRKIKLLCVGLTLAIMVAVYFGFAWQTWKDAMVAYNIREYVMGGTIQISVWQSRFALPFGFALAGIVTAWQFVGLVLGYDRESWLQPLDMEDVE